MSTEQRVREPRAWQRVGILLSIVWALGAGLYNYKAHLTRAEDMSSRDYRNCVNAKEAASEFPELKNFDLGECTAEAAQTYEYWSQWKWSGAVLFALAPIPIAWLIVYGLRIVMRWIRRGFISSA
jgi:hypothetical protein